MFTVMTLDQYERYLAREAKIAQEREVTRAMIAKIEAGAFWRDLSLKPDTSEPSVIPATYTHYRRIKPGHARNSDTFAIKGGMQGCVTSGNGLGCVPAAFTSHVNTRNR